MKRKPGADRASRFYKSMNALLADASDYTAGTLYAARKYILVQKRLRQPQILMSTQEVMRTAGKGDATQLAITRL
jgi:hypothetical protein